MGTKQNGFLSVTIYIICGISLLSNAIFLIVYFLCPLKKIKSYKYFFLLTVLEDVVFSATFGLLVPMRSRPSFCHEELRGRKWMIVIAKDSHTVAFKWLYTEDKSVTVGEYCLFLGIQIDKWMMPHNYKEATVARHSTRPRLVVSGSDYIIFFNTGIISDRTVASILLTVFTVSFFTSLLLVTNSFLHRYLQLCRSMYFEKYSFKQTVTIGCFVNLAIVLNIVIAMYMVFWPEENFVHLVMRTVSIPGVDIKDAAFIGFSLKYNLNANDLLLLVNLVAIVISMVLLNIFCAKRIISYLRSASQRTSFLSLQRQMFVLLLLQSACPLFFLQVPWLFSVLLLFAGISTTSFTTGIISVSIALYPISSPVVIMAFMKDYRNFILQSLRIKSRNITTVGVIPASSSKAETNA